MCQRKYTLDILDDIDLTATKLEKFPMKKIFKITLTNGDLLHDPTKYRRLIEGSFTSSSQGQILSTQLYLEVSLCKSLLKHTEIQYYGF